MGAERSGGAGGSSFNDLAVDNSGNVYAAGSQGATGPYIYGIGVTALSSAYLTNVVLVKYNSSGEAQWAQSVQGPSEVSEFCGVTTDDSGNVYAAGSQSSTDQFTYGPGVSVAGSYVGGNIVLVKYNSAGTAQWARSVQGAADGSAFYGVALHGSNLYAAGYQSGTGLFDYGNGVTVTGGISSGSSLLVKYR